MESPGKVCLIDTNVIIRYLLEDHQAQSQKAKAFMLKVSQGKRRLEIPWVVIVECIYVLEKYYAVPRNEIADSINGILNFTGIVNPDRSEMIQALLKYKTSNTDIVDCILAAKSSPGKPVVSFDNDLEKLNAVTEKL